MSPHIFLFRFCIWKGFKNKSGVFHVSYEELFLLHVTHSKVDVETEFGMVSLISAGVTIVAIATGPALLGAPRSSV